WVNVGSTLSDGAALPETGRWYHRPHMSGATDYVERARALAHTIASFAGRIEAERRLPAHLADALHEAGLFRMLLPRSLGGAELDPPTFVQVMEEIARTDASTAWVLGQTAGCSMIAAYLEHDAAARVFGPPRAVLAWGAGPQGRAVAVEGGYRLTGTWSFASGLHQATWLGAHAPIVGADGAPQQHPDGAPIVRTLLFPIAAATVTDVWHVMGLRATGSDTYAVKDLFVPRAYVLARVRDILAEVGRSGTLTLAQRVRVRQAASPASREGREVGTLLYHAAGAHAIFAGAPWERRMRDLHSVSQQVQARDDHFENVGRFLLGLDPDPTFL